MHRDPLPRLLFLLLCLACLRTGHAQCAPQWLAGDPPVTMLGAANRLVVWDPDGTGPQPLMLVAAGGVTANYGTDARVAAFDGTRWNLLGDRQSVGAMIVYNGQLVIAASDAVRRWNGSTWQSLGAVAGVQSLTVYNGDLIAGGLFSTIGGVSANNIARWNGSTWAALGAGIGGTSVRVLAAFNGLLYVGGSFSSAGGAAAGNLASWNGSSWLPTAAANAPVDALASYSGVVIGSALLFVGGSFTTIGGIAAQHVARFTPATNSWAAFGTGLGGSSCNALHAIDSGFGYELLATTLATSGDRIFRWNGPTAAWVSLGFPPVPGGYVPAALSYLAGQHILGINLGLAFQVQPAVYRLVGGTWEAIVGPGIPNTVSAVRASGTAAVIGGDFAAISGVTVNGIARGAPGNWAPMGAGMGPGGRVAALTTMPNGDLIAGGTFTSGGGGPGNYVARWNGSVWSAIGSGVNGPVTALIGLPNGDLVAAGPFTMAGGGAANHIARWNGLGWAAMGAGFNGPVYAVTSLSNGDVIAGGAFSESGLQNVARWNGLNWFPMGAGPSGLVRCLARLPLDRVAAGGLFSSATATRIAVWNGSAWGPAETAGPALDFSPNALATLADGDLVAGGDAIYLDGALMRLHNGAWVPLGESGPSVSAIDQAADGDLLIGGSFVTVGGLGSVNFARRDAPCPAATLSYGSGCAHTGGSLLLTAKSKPWVGGTYLASATTFLANTIAIEVLGFGAVSVPLTTIHPSGGAGCALLVTPDVLQVSLPIGGIVSTHFAVPPDPALAGVVFRQQIVQAQFGPAGFTGLHSTNALRLTVGLF